MAKVRNRLNQPLVLDFALDYVVRLNAGETKEIKDSYLVSENRVFANNKKDLQVLVKPKKPIKEVSDEKAEN